MIHIDEVSQVNVWDQNVKMSTAQRREIAARKAALFAVDMGKHGKIADSPAEWMRRDIERAVAAEIQYEREYRRDLDAWIKWGEDRGEPKPPHSNRYAWSVKVLRRALALIEDGYPDSHDPGSVLLYA